MAGMLLPDAEDRLQRASGWRRLADTARRLAAKRPADAMHWLREAAQAEREADRLEAA
ncbi:hypothetical protein [Roseococcus pinisoli]|uniref:Uncharacterized protein n=1 Tax=Roseococcus pinisoli TaxID=2835040 RepID=A0ABS5QD32_9PROT|nr:hypothetical protein [Roseococcus pinisoli]MBS7811181.1 hypothetical protein [Roseococcus pinisoli]